MASGCLVLYRGKRGDVWRMKFSDNEGRQHMETLGPARAKGSRLGLTEREARKLLDARLVAIREDRWRPPSPLTFAEWAQTWLEQGEARRAWKMGTANVYRVVVHRLSEAFGKKRLTDLRPRDIAAYITAQSGAGVAPATVNRDVSVLHDILKVAVREEILDTNPAAGAERPRVRQRPWRILRPTEVARVARAIDELVGEATDEERPWRQLAKVAFLTLAMTGLRRHELQALRWRDVDLVENVLRVVDSKTEDGIRSIAIPTVLAEELWQHRRRSHYQGDDERVFCHPDRGTLYRPERWKQTFEPALRRAGIPDYVRPFHDMRHTAITNDAAAGSSPIAVMTKAGHSDMRITQRYVHLAGVVFRDEAQRLEERYGLGAGSTESSTEPTAAERHEL